MSEIIKTIKRDKETTVVDNAHGIVCEHLNTLVNGEEQYPYGTFNLCFNPELDKYIIWKGDSRLDSDDGEVWLTSWVIPDIEDEVYEELTRGDQDNPLNNNLHEYDCLKDWYAAERFDPDYETWDEIVDSCWSDSIYGREFYADNAYIQIKENWRDYYINTITDEDLIDTCTKENTVIRWMLSGSELSNIDFDECPFDAQRQTVGFCEWVSITMGDDIYLYDNLKAEFISQLGEEIRQTKYMKWKEEENN